MISILPLLAGYEVLAFSINYESEYKIRNTADVIFKALTDSFGIHGPVALSLLLLPILFILLALHSFKSTPLRMSYLFGMFIESTVLATFTGFFLSRVTHVFMCSTNSSEVPIVQIMLALGAGVYEEIIFRAFLFYVTGLFLARILKIIPFEAYVISALFSSVIFSWMHFLGGEQFTFFSFTYRFIAGLFFCLLYFLRGLGIAAWSHTIYDLFVMF
jgi:membrane protease YdiL (CAAX protease family)